MTAVAVRPTVRSGPLASRPAASAVRDGDVWVVDDDADGRRAFESKAGVWSALAPGSTVTGAGLAAAFVDRGPVAASTAYVPGDVVLYRGKRILITVAVTTGAGVEPFISVTKYMKLGSEAVFYATDYGVAGDATTDNYAAMNTLIWRVWSAFKGGIIHLPFGVVLTSKPFIVLPGIHLIGAGFGNNANTVGTQIKLTSAADCDVIQFSTDNSSSQAAVLSAATGTSIVASQIKNAFYSGLWNLQVHGNKAAQTPGTKKHGVSIITSPTSSTASGDAEFDPTLILVNVYSRTNTGSGFFQTGRSDVRLVGCVARTNNEYGFRATFDTHYDNCDAGFNGVHGWFGANSSVRFTGCKSYNNGNARAWVSGITIGVGEVTISAGLIYVAKVTNSSTTAPLTDTTNYAPLAVEDVTAFGAGYFWGFGSTLEWAGCEAQQNAGSGWHLKNTTSAVIQGAVGQTNTDASTGTNFATNPSNYAALVLEGASGTIASIAIGGLTPAGYALRIVNGTGAPARNDVTISGDNTQAAALSADSITIVGTSNTFRLNGVSQTARLVDGIDVNVTSPTNTQVLAYNTASSKWVNSSAGASTFAGGFFGDGSDGAATLDGTATVAWASKAGSVYTMTRDAHLGSLTISAGSTLKPSGYLLLCQGTITNDGTIDAIGNAGTSLGVAGATTGHGTVLGGSAGGAGNVGAGSAGTGAGVGIQTGGAGGLGSGGAGGAAGVASATSTAYLRHPARMATGSFSTFGGATLVRGGCGGGGGGGDSVNKGGGGGSGGGIVGIFAHAMTNTGTMSATGGAGGSPATGNCGGGGGGGAGMFYIYTLVAWTNSGTVTAAGGAGGTAVGTGVNGTAGGTMSPGFLNVVVS